MKADLINALDARQTHEWAKFLEHLQWKTKKIGNTYVFIRRMPVIGRSMLKIQHPAGPLDLDKIEIFAEKEKALFTIIEPHTKGYIKSDYIKYGYRESKIQFAHSATIKIDLTQPLESIRNAFSKNAKRNLKKAEKQISIKTNALASAKDSSLVKKFYSMYAGTGKDKNFYVPSFAEVSAKMHAFKKTSYIFFAYEKNSVEKKEPVATLWVGHFDNVLVYFHPGNSKKGYELLANYALVWEALKLGKKLGLQVFDFETIYDFRYPKKNKAWKGYTEFKKKFGGEEVYYPQSWIKFYNPIFKFFYSAQSLFPYQI